MEKPTETEIVEFRDEIGEYLIEKCLREEHGSDNCEFPDGVRQTLSWILGLGGRPGGTRWTDDPEEQKA